MEDLARVDVADPGDPLLVEEEALDRDARAPRAPPQPVALERRGDRIGTERGQRAIAREPRSGDVANEPEAARILEPQLRAVLEGDPDVDVRERARRGIREE